MNATAISLQALSFQKLSLKTNIQAMKERAQDQPAGVLGNDKYILLRWKGRRRTGIARKHGFMVTEVMTQMKEIKQRFRVEVPFWF